jgi:hypothetical protein
MGLWGLVRRLFRRKTAFSQLVDELRVAGQTIKEQPDDRLRQMIENDETSPWYVFEAAHYLALRQRLDLLIALPKDRTRTAFAAIDGLCCAACNGVEGAIEQVEIFLSHAEQEVRLRAVYSLYMVADGTEGDSGSSTAAIRKKARELLSKARGDSDHSVRGTAAQAFQATEHVYTIKRGPGILNYPGRRFGEEALKLANAQKR